MNLTMPIENSGPKCRRATIQKTNETNENQFISVSNNMRWYPFELDSDRCQNKYSKGNNHWIFIKIYIY